MEKVFHRMNKHDVSINIQKATIATKEWEFTGMRYKIDSNIVIKTPSMKHKKQLLKFECPSTTREAVGFLCSLNYLAEYIPNFSAKSKSMRDEIKISKKTNMVLSFLYLLKAYVDSYYIGVVT